MDARAAPDAPPTADSLKERDALQAEVAELKAQRSKVRQRLERSRARLAELTALNDELAARLATGADGFAGPETEYGYLFVVTYGRSGSTLLQGLLSSIPGYLIRGENGGVTYDLFELHRGLVAYREKHGPSGLPSNAWYGIGGYSDGVAFRAMRQLVLATLIRPDEDSRVVGFKEIRWDHEDLPEYAEFLRHVFPGARFIVNTRNLSDVAESKWWSKQTDSPEVLAKVEARLLDLVDRLGEDAFHVHYDDYVNEPSRLEGLFSWLGEPFDDDTVREVMAVRHSY